MPVYEARVNTANIGLVEHVVVGHQGQLRPPHHGILGCHIGIGDMPSAMNCQQQQREDSGGPTCQHPMPHNRCVAQKGDGWFDVWLPWLGDQHTMPTKGKAVSFFESKFTQ